MAKNKPAITGLARPEGIVDDIVIPLAKKAIRATTKKNPAKGLSAEQKMLVARHDKLTQKYVKDSVSKGGTGSRKVGKTYQKSKTNIRSIRETSSRYNADIPKGVSNAGQRRPEIRKKMRADLEAKEAKMARFRRLRSK